MANDSKHPLGQTKIKMGRCNPVDNVPVVLASARIPENQ